METYLLVGQILCVMGLAWVICRVDELSKKPPILIKCDCFRDCDHDDMVKVKEIYFAKKQAEEEKQKQDEEIDNLAKEE